MTAPAIPPLVYLGPSAPQSDVARWLPYGLIRPPVTRGDLYRDRMLRYSLFIVLDGVFLQNQAVPPREVVDVLRDGATIIGASSMGALRAAECWPAGMIGAGSIYWRFRRGVLRSDDEVAVAFNPESPFPSLTVSLVNVRHAVRAEVKAGLVGRTEGDRIVAAAGGIFYADRTWRRILTTAGADPSLSAALSRHDRKRADAIRALRLAACLTERDPQLLRQPRASAQPFATSETTRERVYESFEAARSAPAALALVRWLIASGRVRAVPGMTGNGGDDSETAVWLEHLAVGVAGGDTAAVSSLLGDLAKWHEIDAAWHRCNAIRAAAELARDRGWRPGASHSDLAGREIAADHGYTDFGSLMAELGSAPGVRKLVEEYRHELARAKRVREVMFARPGVTPVQARHHPEVSPR